METIKSIYRLFQKHPIVCTDTRSIAVNSIFFALKGDNFDGNKFAHQAMEQGSSYAIIDNETYKKDDRYILVDDVLSALQQLAHYHRKQLQIPIIGITGTNGKTSTKELISRVLSKKYAVHATQGNLNNHIGVPLTLLSITDSTQMAVVEMGANHVGEIDALCRIAEPTFGIITNIGKAHLEGFGDLDTIISTKNELYNFVRQVNGTVFVNHDDALLMDLSKDMSVVSYGTSNDADCIGKMKPIDDHLFIQLKWRDKKNASCEAKTGFIGTYNFNNILAAVCIGKHFGVSDQEIQQVLESYRPKNNRSEIVERNTNTILMDAYNANPTSMQLVLKDIIQLRDTNKVLILGDMFELGEYASEEHQAIVDLIAPHLWKKVILVGQNFYSTLAPTLFVKCKTTVDALAYLKSNPLTHSFILIKGSRGMRLESLLETL